MFIHASLPQCPYPLPCKPEQAGGQSPLLMSHTEAEKCPQMAAKETQLPSRHSFGPEANPDICMLPSLFLPWWELLEKCRCFTREGYDRILYCVTQARDHTFWQFPVNPPLSCTLTNTIRFTAPWTAHYPESNFSGYVFISTRPCSQNQIWEDTQGVQLAELMPTLHTSSERKDQSCQRQALSISPLPVRQDSRTWEKFLEKWNKRNQSKIVRQGQTIWAI